MQDLIFRLLQEPETRLCSPKYQRNDYRRNVAGYIRIDRAAKDFCGSHVYSDDAEDIKRHPFFQGVDWENLEHMTPPWIPRVNTSDSTKYFDSEEQILGSSLVDSGISMDDQLESKSNPRPADERRAAVGGMDGQRMERDKKAKRRPRDKLLRDPVVSKTVMDSRKRNAFLGYTYRIPQMWRLLGRPSVGGESSSQSRDTEGDFVMSGC